MRAAVAAFAKTPELSPVKTRLAADIGKSLSEQFYRNSVRAIEEVLESAVQMSNGSLEAYWALAEKHGGENHMWKSFQCIWTGNGGLGKRMSNISSGLLEGFDISIIIGTDSPQMNPNLFTVIMEKLMEKPETCLIGPSRDGGFYLLATTFPVPESIWTKITYSEENTLQQLLLEHKKANIQYELLDTLVDCDTILDMRILYHDLLIRAGTMLPAQERLLSWIQDNGIF